MIGTLRVLSWALHARWATEAQVRRTGLRDLAVPPAPRVGRHRQALVARVLGVTRATCLVRVLVLQKFLLAQGIEVDVVVGATSPRDGFSAHAWLAGDHPDHRGHTELLRLDAHGGEEALMARRGSYGLVLTGLAVPDDGLCTLPDDSPELQVRVVRDFSDVSPADRVEVIDLLDDGRLALNADASLATYVVGEPPSAHEILHPWLAQAAINRSLALDRLVLHGGLLSTANGAVAVLGDREAGKSTLMAHAAMAGVEVLSDDVVVVDGPHVLTGPRCIDLREPAAARLLTDLRVVRDGSRWRMALPPAPWRSVLSGVVVLRWGDRLEVTRLPPRARLADLAPHLACAPTPRARARLLPAAEIPVTVITRPRDFGLLGAVLKLVLGV